MTTSIALTQIPHYRLYQQQLTQNHFATAEEIVAWMGAVQAQEYLGTKWALGLRMQDATDSLIEQAFHEGRILRTHVMRPTWHFVTPVDIRWLLALTAARVHAINAPYNRQLGLDAATLARSNDVIVRALEGSRFLTRTEIGAALETAQISTTGSRSTFIMLHAELDAIVCSGPRRGKQFTYALLDERAPQAKSLPYEEALAELVRRYFTSHGPATARDFAWWSGLTLADAKAGLASVADQLAYEDIDNQRYWFSTAMPPIGPPSASAFLLPTYDEFLVGFRAFDQQRRNGGNLVFDSTVVLKGQVAGSWKRTLRKADVLIQIAPFAPLTDDESAAVSGAAQRYGQFVEMPVTIQFI
jgi:hypothetical protein